MPPLEVHTDTVRQMAAAFTAGTLRVDLFLRGACKVLGERLHCDRVNIWRFEGPPGLRTLRCVVACPAYPAHPAEDLLPELCEAEYGDCFTALSRSGYVASADVRTDARLAGLWHSHLAPRRIRSLLGAGFSVNGRTVGMLCCEQSRDLRQWVPAEVATVRRACTTLSLALTKSGEWEQHFPEDMPVTRS
jgi:GAF domain-containing protein